MWDVEIKVTGLDDNGHLTGMPGGDAEIHCKAFSKSIDFLLPSQTAQYSCSFPCTSATIETVFPRSTLIWNRQCEIEKLACY